MRRSTVWMSSNRVSTYTFVPGMCQIGASSRRRSYEGYQSSCVAGSKKFTSSGVAG